MGVIGYRREIDGLRAIAVSAVVLYHASLPFPAGFVGVDVFFVISGYLITALLLRDERIDIAGFYARRVRRILPAGLLVVLASLAAGAILLTADEQRQLVQSAAAASVFGANLFYQITTSGYFHAETARMPLLHLWSLSVEEQFYLVWPALLIVLPRKRLPIVLGGLALVSFGLAEWLMLSRPEAAFYQMPARFWELAVGGLIAALPARKLSAWPGIVLTIAACVIPIAHFPGYGSLPAVAGAALIIAAVHGGATNAILSSRPVVGLGLISYSLYLWHWPLLAFYRATVIGEGAKSTKLALCGVAVLLAIATYRYVETPFRRARWPSWCTVTTGAAICLMLAVGCAYRGQLPAVALASTPAERAAADRDVAFSQRCEYALMDPTFPRPTCLPDSRARLVVWGDSMASAWAPAILVRDEHATAFTRSGCPPLVGYAVAFRAKVIADLCKGFNAQVLQTAKGDTLILAARWGQYAGMDAPLAATLAAVTPRFRRVVLMGASPELPDSAPHCIALGVNCAVPLSSMDEWRGPQGRLARIAAKFSNVTVLDPAVFLCRGGTCYVARDGYALYTDAYHPSATAARAYGAGLGL